MTSDDKPILDRLSALAERFALTVTVNDRPNANLAIFSVPANPVTTQNTASNKTASKEAARIAFTPGSLLRNSFDDNQISSALFCGHVQWGGDENPLITALPECIDYQVTAEENVDSLVTLLVNESRNPRCGSASVLNRLAEVLIIRLLRHQISIGSNDVGLLAGMADLRLCHAIVGMHDDPGRAWNIDQLAELSGLSTSRFCDRFTVTVGQSPMSYLRGWRMILARQDVEKGDRIQSIASRYGYASTEALTRAFKRYYGENPTSYRAAARV